MDLLYTFTDIRYWSKILHSTTPILLGGLEVKIINLEILCLNLGFPWLKFFKDAYFLNPLMALLNAFTDIRYWSKVLCPHLLPWVKVIDLEISR